MRALLFDGLSLHSNLPASIGIAEGHLNFGLANFNIRQFPRPRITSSGKVPPDKNRIPSTMTQQDLAPIRLHNAALDAKIR